MIRDLEVLEASVLPVDPSFRTVDRADIARLLSGAAQAARAGAKDAFLLALMRLLARPGNGHTRLIPNAAVSILPLRFVTIGASVRLLGAPPECSWAIGQDLVAINCVPLRQIEHAAEPFLAGTLQRRRVIGPFLFAWPGALRHMGVISDGGSVQYEMRDDRGRITALTIPAAQTVPGSALYPQNEHGRADASWVPGTYLATTDFGPRGIVMELPSFFDPGATDLSAAMSEAADLVRSRPTSELLIDVRGNTGGNFLRTLPLIDAILEGSKDRHIGVLVDKFTFSAAIVFVALLKYRLGARLKLIGEDMGDGLTFFAEGGTIELSTGGAVVRYSTAFHDWAGGTTDATTPREIARQIVPVGALTLDRRWSAQADDIEARDQLAREVLGNLSA